MRTLLFFLTAFLGLSLQQKAFALFGNGVGGGGFVLDRGNTVRFLDTYSLPCTQAGLSLGDNLLGRDINFSVLPYGTRVLQLVNERDARFKPFNEKLRTSLYKLKFTVTQKNLSHIREQYIAPYGWKGEVKPVAKYYDGKVELQQSLASRMCLLDQTSKVIHEALRQVQIDYSGKFDTATLQKMTLAYMTGNDPEGLLEVDRMGDIVWLRRAGWISRMVGIDYYGTPRKTYENALNPKLKVNYLNKGAASENYTHDENLEIVLVEAMRVKACLALSLWDDVNVDALKINGVTQLYLDQRFYSSKRIVEYFQECFSQYGYPAFDLKIATRRISSAIESNDDESNRYVIVAQVIYAILNARGLKVGND